MSGISHRNGKDLREIKQALRVLLYNQYRHEYYTKTPFTDDSYEDWLVGRGLDPGTWRLQDKWSPSE